MFAVPRYEPGTRLFACVYRRSVPKPQHLRLTMELAEGDPLLSSFLDEYWREDRYYDWGDDPSFFCSKRFFGDTRRASWGVCRPDIRRTAQVGDAVAFFCGKAAVTWRNSMPIATGPYDYFYIGWGTIAELLNRYELALEPQFEMYRRFFNILARPGTEGAPVQSETFYKRHDEDWQRRAAAPYVVFDPVHTFFNLDCPHCVSHYDPDVGVPDRWHRDSVSRRLEHLLFAAGQNRRLRTSHTGFGHSKLPAIQRPVEELGQLRDELVNLARR